MLDSVGEQLVGNPCSGCGMTWARRRGTLGMLDFFTKDVFFVVKISGDFRHVCDFDSKDELFLYSRDVVLSLHRSCCR